MAIDRESARAVDDMMDRDWDYLDGTPLRAKHEIARLRRIAEAATALVDGVIMMETYEGGMWRARGTGSHLSKLVDAVIQGRE